MYTSYVKLRFTNISLCLYFGYSWTNLKMAANVVLQALYYLSPDVLLPAKST